MTNQPEQWSTTDSFAEASGTGFSGMGFGKQQERNSEVNTKYLPGKIARAILGLTLLIGMGVGLSATAHAQGRYGNQDRRNRNWDGYPNWGGSFDLRQTALNAGYNEGTKEGRNDRA